MAGKFIGKVVVEWLSNAGADRNMELKEDFSFIDAASLRWDAPQGAVINGASIPRIFWTSFGPPFVGDYRRASVIHDHFCNIKTRSSKKTHRMFEEGCRAGGVPAGKAKLMYAAVKTFGPNWKNLANTLSIPGRTEIEAGTQIDLLNSMNLTDFDNLLNWIEAEDPDLDSIDAEIEENLLSAPIISGITFEG